MLNGAPMRGADIEDGIASVRAMVAIARSVRERQAGRARRRRRARCDAARHLRQDLRGHRRRRRCSRAVADAGYRGGAVQHGLLRACRRMPDAIPPERGRGSRRGGARDRRRDRGGFGHLQHDPSRSGRARARAAPARGPRRGRAGDGHAADDAVHRHARLRTTSGASIPTTPTPEAWRDLLAEHGGGDRDRRAHDVDLGIEPELANVVVRRAEARAADRRDAAARGSGSCSIRPISSRLATRGAQPQLIAEADRSAGRPDRHGACQGPRRRRQLRHRRTGRRSTTRTSRPPAPTGFDGPLVTHGLDRGRGAGGRRVPARRTVEAGRIA